MPLAARSLIDPPGFMNSALPKISQPVSFEIDFNKYSGVSPTDPHNVVGRFRMGLCSSTL
jgi:hypothetical protein